MPLDLPNLADFDWNQLMEEGRLLIPATASDWTNHNASDPGITLVELFAYICDMLLYRVNRVGDAELKEFLHLIYGPEWKSSEKPMHRQRLTAAVSLRDIHRAVTAGDFETLALVANQSLQLAYGEKVARTKCIPQRNLKNTDQTSQPEDAPGHISLVVVSTLRAHPSTALLRAVRQALEPARLLTTRVNVVRPRYVTFTVRLTLVPQADAVPSELRDDAVQTLERFFDPLHGWFDGRGWPFGRSVYVSEIYQLLYKLPGVDHIIKSRHPVSGDEIDELIVGSSHADRLKWNEVGELEAITFDSDELAAVWVDRSDISVNELLR